MEIPQRPITIPLSSPYSLGWAIKMYTEVIYSMFIWYGSVVALKKHYRTDVHVIFNIAHKMCHMERSYVV